MILAAEFWLNGALRSERQYARPNWRLKFRKRNDFRAIRGSLYLFGWAIRNQKSVPKKHRMNEILVSAQEWTARRDEETWPLQERLRRESCKEFESALRPHCMAMIELSVARTKNRSNVAKTTRSLFAQEPSNKERRTKCVECSRNSNRPRGQARRELAILM